VLDPDRVTALFKATNIGEFHQLDDYALVMLNSYKDGMKLREVLDPHIFILQIDSECNMLEINFNPTPAQIEALRRLRVRLLNYK
jgi:hypothetical protein